MCALCCQAFQIEISALPLVTCMPPSRLLNSPLTQFPPLSNRDNISIYLWGLIDIWWNHWHDAWCVVGAEWWWLWLSSWYVLNISISGGFISFFLFLLYYLKKKIIVMFWGRSQKLRHHPGCLLGLSLTISLCAVYPASLMYLEVLQLKMLLSCCLISGYF